MRVPVPVLLAWFAGCTPASREDMFEIDGYRYGGHGERRCAAAS